MTFYLGYSLGILAALAVVHLIESIHREDA